MPARSTAAIAAHTCGRYAVQLLVITGAAFVPLLYLALKVPIPTNLDQMNGVLRTPWLLAGVAWIFQLAVVGAAAPLAHAIARGAPLSQRAATRAVLLGFVRGLLPIGLAAAAILTGLVALIAPGLVLLALFSLTAAVAATTPGSALPAQLRDSAALVRRSPVPVAIVVGAMLAFDIAAVLVAKQVLVTGAIGKAPTPAQLAGAGQVARIAIAAIALATPIAATALAAIHARRATS